MKRYKNKCDIISNVESEEEKLFFEQLDEEDIELSRENKLVEKLDPEILKYFNDARLITKRSKTRLKQKKKKKKSFKINDQVKYKNISAQIIYGPFDNNNVKMYEIETDSGDILSVSYNDIDEY